ncbi:dnaJ homolog subfamily C member 1 isoform X2 [Scyliorhinus canicula]|uniref:dnaJ homolog subfamily C member 1 isoform X2 n=1 Tax=Scyliorhinus canicula TaxID=7830 RepID=UPI0018F41F32|nr:dnaJ homolog subfamily C member 1 isoform X2 [Scyliorhinus canicula]
MPSHLSPAAWALMLLMCVPQSLGWDTAEMELFDLVEEVQENFYRFLGVEQDASSADIRKAYRKMSLILHPDKNKDENAEIQFRQLVAIYEVLKDEEKRQRYNEVLENGLPDWRQPVFYYRRVRKLSNVELSLLLFIILTVGHYAVVWSIYFEKQLDDLLSRKKREKKKKTSGKTMDEGKVGVSEKNERSVIKPHWQDLLPCKIGIWFYFFLKSLPQCYQGVKDFYLEWKEMKVKEKEEAETQTQLETVQKEKRPKIKKPKSEFPVYTAPTSGSIAYVPLHEEASTIEEIEEQVADWLEGRSRGPRKVTTKAKQVKDFVSSTPGTVKILDLKSVSQTAKSAKREAVLPDDIITKRDEEVEGEHEFENGDDQDNYTEALSTETRPRKRKTAKTSEPTLMIHEEIEQKLKGRRQRDFDNTELDDDSDEEKKRKGKIRSSEESAELWNQNQQKLLELALQQYPKGTSERWDKIAKCVPGKTKEECIIRYKLLAELVMKRKQAKS